MYTRVRFHGKEIWLPPGIKTGQCAICTNNIDDKSCKITTMYSPDGISFTELCNACLNRYYRDEGFLKNKLENLTKKCILCGETKTKSYFHERLGRPYQRWFRFKDGIICYTCKARLKATKLRRRLGIKIREFRQGVKLAEQIRKTDNYIRWRNAVLAKDRYRCLCGSTHRLNAHHIISFREILSSYKINSIDSAMKCDILWDVYNGRTLCYPCHRKTVKKEP